MGSAVPASAAHQWPTLLWVNSSFTSLCSSYAAEREEDARARMVQDAHVQGGTTASKEEGCRGPQFCSELHSGGSTAAGAHQMPSTCSSLVVPCLEDVLDLASLFPRIKSMLDSPFFLRSHKGLSSGRGFAQ